MLAWIEVTDSSHQEVTETQIITIIKFHQYKRKNNSFQCHQIQSWHLMFH